MLLAAIDDTAYELTLLIHIVAFLVGFAPAVINPLLAGYLEKNSPQGLGPFAAFSARFTQQWSLPALGVLLITGVLLILLSDDVWEFSQGWISFAFLVWFAIGGVVSAMILKGEKQLAAGDVSGQPLVVRGGQIATVLLLIMLYLMVFKPGV